MKLSTRISAAAVVFFLLFSQIFSRWILGRIQEEMLQMIQTQEKESLDRQTMQFYRMMSTKGKQDSQGEIYWGQEAFIKCFSGNAVLYYKGKEIFNSTPYIFAYKDIQNSILQQEVDGRKLLVFGIEAFPYQIVHYRDVTSVYDQAEKLFWKGMGAALLFAALLAMIFRLVMKKILRPLYRLKCAADGFVRGNYGERLLAEKKDEIGEISRAFNHMADRVEAHIQELAEENEKQRRLLGSLAHELKTPMTAIQGYAQTLQRVSLSPERQEKALHYIEKECKRLSRLSGKMLEFTRLSEENRIEQRELSVAGLLEMLPETLHDRLEEKGLQIVSEVSETLWIRGDADLLTSFFLNLADNACKAAAVGTCISIAGDENGVFIQNQGEEIPPEELEKIAEPFYMIDKSRSRKEGGAGLGLALCSRIAALHGGRLVMENLPGYGVRAGIVTEWLHWSEDLDTEIPIQ